MKKAQLMYILTHNNDKLVKNLDNKKKTTQTAYIQGCFALTVR